MKRTTLLAAIILTMAMNGQPLAAPAQDPEQFAGFWARFKSAVVKNDREAVASMTRLPFLFESEERDQAGFLNIYDHLFNAEVRKCFASAKPLKEDDLYAVFCAKQIFYFGVVDGEYLFTEFGADY